MTDTNMTVDQAIAYAAQWAPAIVRGADGWRVVCMVLAHEVQRLRGDRDSWEQQASDRTDDAVRFVRERDNLQLELDELRRQHDIRGGVLEMVQQGRDEWRDAFHRLQSAANAVLMRWDSPQWEWLKHGPTADLMAELRQAAGEQTGGSHAD